MSVKDHIAVKGVKLTVGLPCFANNPPMEEDAEIIKRLKKAGAIPFVYTNVPEGVMWGDAYNRIYGLTSNPYDTRKSVGGSSGGEGAILGAGASVIGIGSDIGGSVRIPAMFNGVFGMKPSARLTTFKGCVPGELHGFHEDMAVIGPMTRYAKDLMPMFKIGRDGARDLLVKFGLGKRIKGRKI
jgi:fatty acid amide hydrolase 2